MRLISPLSIDSILSFDGVIITDRNITDYDANENLSEILELEYSHKSNNITNLSEEGLVKFVQFPEEFDSEIGYTNWKIKSILLYRGSIEDGDTTLLAILNEDIEQTLTSKRFNFRIYFEVKTNLINISYIGGVKSVPHISEKNLFIKPLYIDPLDRIINKSQAIEKNKNQLVSSNLVVKDSNKFINLFEKLELKNNYEFKLLLPQLIEGVPFLTGVILEVFERNKAYFSIDFVRKNLYIQRFTSDTYGPFVERWVKDFNVIVIPSDKILIGATVLDLVNSKKLDLVNGLESQINKLSYEKGILTYSENSDFTSILPDNIGYLIKNGQEEDLVELDSNPSKFSILTDEFLAILNTFEQNTPGVTLIDRETGDRNYSQSGPQSSVCLVAMEENFAVYCKLVDLDYMWHLITDGNFSRESYGKGKTCVINLFGNRYLFENLKTLTKV